MRVVQHVAADLREQLDRHQRQPRPGQRHRRGDRAEGVGEQQRGRAQERGPEHRQRHHAPVLHTGGAQDHRGLAPFLAQAFQRRGDDQHHQRDLEIEVGQHQADEAEQVEAGGVDVHPEPVARQHGDKTDAAQRRDEGEGERHAGKVRRDTRERQHTAAQPAGQVPQRDRRGDQKARETADHGGQQAEPDRHPEGVQNRRAEQVAEVGERDIALRIDKGADDDVQRRQDQKQHREQQERHNAEPVQRQSSPRLGGSTDGGRHGHAGKVRCVSLWKKVRPADRGANRWSGQDHFTTAPTVASQPPVTAALLAACSSSVGNTALV